MSVDALQPTLGVQAVHSRQDANGKSGRNPHHEGKPAQFGKEPQDPHESPNVFLNAQGQLTGKTINVTA